MYCIHKDQHRFLYVTGLSTTTIMDKSLGTLMHFWLIFQFTQVNPSTHPTNNVGRVYPECFLSCNFVAEPARAWSTFRNDWQIRICQLTKCLVEFRGWPFDFWGGYGWFQKKCPADWFQEEKSMQINSWEKNILHWKNYRSWRIMLKKNCTGKKILTSERFGKKFFQYKLNQ